MTGKVQTVNRVTRENKGVIVSFRLSVSEFKALSALSASRPRVGAATPNKFARRLLLDCLLVVNN